VRDSLPVSRLEVDVRQPSGTEDVLLLDARGLDTELAVELAARTASLGGGAEHDWSTLPVPDLDALLLLVRRAVFGDLVRTTLRCPEGDCGALVDITFGIAEYLVHHRPRRPRYVADDPAERGWYVLDTTGVRFRIPTVADLLEAASAELPDRALAERCIDPPNVAAALRRRVERAMNALAPALVAEVTGTCPECRGRIAMLFDPVRYVLRELRDHAASLIEDVDALAARYHWSETEILALPRARRRRYAEAALEGLRAG
jgi:hypothetical protein